MTTYDVFSVGNSGCCWHVGGARIAAAYKAFSPEKFKGDLCVYIGLAHVNITLNAVPQWEDIVGASNNQSEVVFVDVHYNERCAQPMQNNTFLLTNTLDRIHRKQVQD